MPAVPLASSGAHLPVGSLLQAPTLQTPPTRATMNPSLHGIGTLATGNLLPASTTRHGLSLERTSSSERVASQEPTASLPYGPLFLGSQLPPITGR